MVHSLQFKPIALTAVLFFLFVSCASKEVAQLGQSVSDLETRLQRYQQETHKDTAQTTTTLGEVNQSISNAFRDIRSAQSNLETLLERTTSRLSKVELQVQQLQEKTDRLEKQSQNAYSDLTGRVTQVQTESQQSLKDEMARIASTLSELKANNAKALNAAADMQSRLEKRMAAMEAGNREIYEKILKELGVPTTPKKSAKTSEGESKKEESYSGKVHIVEKGEFLSAIAAKYHVSAKAIQELNGIDNPSSIRVGQKLKIPAAEK